MKISTPVYPPLHPLGIVKSIRGYFDYGILGFLYAHHTGNGKYSYSNVD